MSLFCLKIHVKEKSVKEVRLSSYSHFMMTKSDSTVKLFEKTLAKRPSKSVSEGKLMLRPQVAQISMKQKFSIIFFCSCTYITSWCIVFLLLIISSYPAFNFTLSSSTSSSFLTLSPRHPGMLQGLICEPFLVFRKITFNSEGR